MHSHRFESDTEITQLLKANLMYCLVQGKFCVRLTVAQNRKLDNKLPRKAKITKR